MSKKSAKSSAPARIDDYSMQREFDRPKLPTGEYSGIAPTDLAGVPPPKTVQYPLDGGAGSPGEPSRPDLSEEFAARDPDLDPQYVWRGKTKNDLNVLEVKAPIIYQQEKIFPRMLIEDLRRRAAKRRVEEYRHDAVASGAGWQQTLEAIDDWRDAEDEREASFYQHHQGWKNRLILGDSLPVMASLAENEQLRGKVQMVYIDPPYGIKFNSNWQPTTKSTNVKDGAATDITREPEMVKAFRDTWHDGIHSYLGYLRDRLVVARDLLTESGSCFVQISDENVHKVRAILDEVFGENNFISQIAFQKTGGFAPKHISNIVDYVIWYAKQKSCVKFRRLAEWKPEVPMNDPNYVLLEFPDKQYRRMTQEERNGTEKLPANTKVFRLGPLLSSGENAGNNQFSFRHALFKPSPNTHWKTTILGLERLNKADLLLQSGKGLSWRLHWSDNPILPLSNIWEDTQSGGFVDSGLYVVQTTNKVIQRCLLMTTDPGDLVLDPTCGSGTTAYVAEQWGRRWITIDTSRVALAISRRRLMSAKFPYYLLADSPEGLRKEMEVKGKAIDRPTFGKVSQGFVYERVPHITLKGIANNAEIDVIWEKYEAESERLRLLMPREIPHGSGERSCESVKPWGVPPREEWEVPFEAPEDWSDEAKAAHAEFLELKRKRQAEMDASIARTAETEFLYDRPYEDKKRIRVAGPFTVESLAPVRSLIARDDGEPVDPAKLGRKEIDYGNGPDYVRNMLEVLRKSGVKQTRKSDRITFTSLAPWAGGRHVVAEGWTDPGDDPNAKSKRVAVAIGPEFGSVTRLEMNAAAKEAREGGFDLLLVCAFNFEAYVEEGSGNAVGMKTLLARMNADLHMSTDLKETGSGNPFVVFGEPDIEIRHGPGGEVSVAIRGVDVYDPKKGEVRSDDADAIDCWMLDTDYNEEAFFARQVYFPGKKDVYKAFKVFLKDDIDEEEWASVAKTESRPFPRPESGLIAVKVINHFGDEVMKIFHV